MDKIQRKRGCRPGSLSRGLYFDSNGKLILTTRVWLSLPIPVWEKLELMAKVTHESPSQIITSLIDAHLVDPQLMPPIAFVEESEPKTPEGRKGLWARVTGGYMPMIEMLRIRPLIAASGCDLWRLFRFFLRKLSDAQVASIAAEAMANKDLDPLHPHR